VAFRSFLTIFFDIIFESPLSNPALPFHPTPTAWPLITLPLQMRQLCAAVAPHLPEFVLGDILLDLLHVDLQAGVYNAVR